MLHTETENTTTYAYSVQLCPDNFSYIIFIPHNAFGFHANGEKGILSVKAHKNSETLLFFPFEKLPCPCFAN